jgi:hypothetical protein
MSKNVGQLLVDIIPEKHQWKMDLFQQWNSIIGSLADKVRIERIKDDQLILGVTHPAWAQELFLMSHVIKQKVNNALDHERIKNIQFRTIDFEAERKVRAKKKNTCDPGDIICNQVVLNDKEQQKLLNIENNDLRKVLEKFYIRCKKQRMRKSREK